MSRKYVSNYKKFKDFKSEKRYGICYSEVTTGKTVTYTTDDIAEALKLYSFFDGIEMTIFDRFTNETIKLGLQLK